MTTGDGWRRDVEDAVDSGEGHHRTRHLLQEEADDAHGQRENAEQGHGPNQVANRHTRAR